LISGQNSTAVAEVDAEVGREKAIAIMERVG
jgi:hypothetical protein